MVKIGKVIKKGKRSFYSVVDDDCQRYYAEAKRNYCKSCNKELNNFDGEKLCQRCGFNKTTKIGLLTMLIVFLISIPITMIQFNYEVGKCDNLRSAESSYDFNQKVELNAQYNEDCYFLHNHPLAFAQYLLMGLLFAMMAGLITSGVYLTFTR